MSDADDALKVAERLIAEAQESGTEELSFARHDTQIHREPSRAHVQEAVKSSNSAEDREVQKGPTAVFLGASASVRAF